MRKLFTIILIFSIYSQIFGQDLHFTNNRFAPIQFNPSQIGAFEASLRAGSIYRSQFSDFIQRPYESILLYVDAPLSFSLRKNDWTGIGVQFYKDRAGDLSLTNTGMMGGVSYHLSSDAKYTRVLSLGATYGLNFRTLDVNSAIFPDFLQSGNKGNDFNKLNNLKTMSGDLNVGLSYKQKINKTNIFQAGIGLLYAFRSSFDAIKENQNSRRWNANLNYQMALSDKKTSLEWAGYYSRMGDFQNASIQAIAQRKLSKKDADDFMLQLGLGYRLGDALQILTGAKYNGWNVAISYEITVSDAKIYNQYKGAIELALFKILVFNTKPVVHPIIFCPKL